MTFDAEQFRQQLRRQLAGEPIERAADAPVPTPAPAPTVVVEATKGDAGPFKWRMIPQRNSDGLITSVELAPVERVTLP